MMFISHNHHFHDFENLKYFEILKFWITCNGYRFNGHISIQTMWNMSRSVGDQKGLSISSLCTEKTTVEVNMMPRSCFWKFEFLNFWKPLTVILTFKICGAHPNWLDTKRVCPYHTCVSRNRLRKSTWCPGHVFENLNFWIFKNR